MKTARKIERETITVTWECLTDMFQGLDPLLLEMTRPVDFKSKAPKLQDIKVTRDGLELHWYGLYLADIDETYPSPPAVKENSTEEHED